MNLKTEQPDQPPARWAVSVQSGEWYIFDGVAWQPANPPAPASTGRPAPWTIIKSIIGFGMVCLIAVILLSWSAVIAPSVASPPLEPSPRPPVKEDKSGGGGNSVSSAIGGVVTDLSTGRPGAGLEVSINGQIVRTDTDGSYSITGLAAGTYTTVLELKGQGTLAQEPLLIYVDGRTPATVDLGFYSQTPPTSTPLPTATATVTPTPAVIVPVSPTAAPVRLPPSGADLRYRPWLISGLGLLLVGVGVGVRRYKVPKLKEK